jgi:hypothetical protein
MPLIDRLAGFTGEGEPEHNNISVLTFWAMLFEMSKGKITKAQIESYLNLDAGERTEMDWLVGKYNAQPNATAKAAFVDLMQIIFLLASDKVPGYTTNAELVARINAI